MRRGIMALLVVLGFYGFKILYDDGIVGQTKKPLRAPVLAAKGCFCHGDSASPRTRVWISGPDSVRAGTQVLFQVNVAKDTNIAAGFNVAAFLGNLGVRDTAGTQLMRVDPSNPIDSLELTHTDPKLAGGRDTISWQFWYRAPSIVGLIDTIYANGNSVDTSRDPDGDYWNYAPNFLVRIARPTSGGEEPVAQSFRLKQNYPNPFNPSTVIRYELAEEGNVTLVVFDIAGREVATLVNGVQNAGMQVATFDTHDAHLASGVYLYRLAVTSARSRFADVKKMILAK